MQHEVKPREDIHVEESKQPSDTQVTESEALHMLCNSEMTNKFTQSQDDGKTADASGKEEVTMPPSHYHDDEKTDSGEEDNPSDDEFDGPFDNDNKLLDEGSENQILSDVDDVDEAKLLDGSTKPNFEPDDSSSGASGSYAGQEYYAQCEDDFHDDDSQEFVQTQNSSGKQLSGATENPEDFSADKQPKQMLPPFGSLFGKSTMAAQNLDREPVARMQSTIHPPGTNEQMQMLMKSRLPSTQQHC